MRRRGVDPSAERQDAWLAEQLRGFENLRGLVVTGWQGAEWPIRFGDGDGTESRFEDPTVSFLQFSELSAVIDADVPARFRSEQVDDLWGLSIERVERTPRASGGSSRERDSLPLPVGTIERVDVRIEDSVIAEVSMRISGVDVLLMAGEVSDNYGEPLHWHRLDESVLVFTTPSDADSIDWAPLRRAYRPRQGEES